MLTLSVAEYIIGLHNSNSPVQYNVRAFQTWASLERRGTWFDGIMIYKLSDVQEFLRSEFYEKIA